MLAPGLDADGLLQRVPVSEGHLEASWVPVVSSAGMATPTSRKRWVTDGAQAAAEGCYQARLRASAK